MRRNPCCQLWKKVQTTAAALLDAGRDKPLEGYLYSVVDNIALPFRQGYKISALLNQAACL